MWTAIIAGSGLGVGAIASLIFYIKATKAEGRLAVAKTTETVLRDQLLAARDQLVSANAATAALVQSQKDDLAKRDAVIKNYEERVEKLNDLLKQSTVPAIVVTRIGQLFPVPKKDDNG